MAGMALLLRPPPSEHGKLEYLEKAIHILKSDVPKPLTLQFNGNQDIGLLVGAMDVFRCDLLAS